MIKSTVETIDRELAERYLNLDRGNNRPFSPQHLTDLVGRQKRGEWVTNGDTIRFDTGGQLRDGQHRLRMVKQTGIPIEVVVVRDIDPAVFKTIDTGKHRSLGDVLFIDHEENSSQLAGALSWVWRYLSRKMIGRIGSYEQCLETLNQHPGIHDSVAFYLNLDRPAGIPGWPSVTTSIHYLFSRVDATKANDFITRYVGGLHLEEPTDPIAVLRGQIVSYAKASRKPTGLQVFSLIAHAWNAHEAHLPVKKRFKLSIPSPASPRIAGFPKELFLQRELAFLDNEEEEMEG